ncbi:hypothetical protein BU24DRAFT_423870 [Aaosphaeria arxii CBS 175.79]|uniref:Uncharacterized protein n=1 Tax=Aaosphaeria arxii CBS 175.79 TaxID=1450172 RepID=A0A6A5XQB8_9PLEO|nr:uncharacterized protein BU24DRAFT_423870 [Aaosphaeria arxii CBS 175.79]KAF2014951.1 hypothetical protein BU24DRAFT_423870 [Aaosphaeria arxii CBS 175.79]
MGDHHRGRKDAYYEYYLRVSPHRKKHDNFNDSNKNNPSRAQFNTPTSTTPSPIPPPPIPQLINQGTPKKRAKADQHHPSSCSFLRNPHGLNSDHPSLTRLQPGGFPFPLSDPPWPFRVHQMRINTNCIN